MKILMTLMGLDIGGAETHVMELAKELQRQGHEIVLASNGGAYVPVLEEAGVRHVCVPMNQRDPKQMLRALLLLKKLIRQEQPDLVHAHARIPAFLCGILQRQMGFPFITTAHWVFQVTPLLRRITDWGQRTVAVSEDIKTYLMREYQVPEDQIHVTINGIDTEEFAPNRTEEALRSKLALGDGPVVCHVSRLDESRALAARQLLEIWTELLARIPAARLLLVGGGDQETALRQQAEEINRAAGWNTVVMTGPRTDIAALVSLGDVFVGASRAVLEAMSEEKPVILAGNEGYMGLFRPGMLESAQATNFCYRGYPEVTGEALLADLCGLLTLPEPERKALGQYGRQVVQEEYSVAKMAADYLEAYRKLLHPPKPVHAVISGYYGFDNLGDDAILQAIARQLSRMEHPVRLTVLSRRPRETEARFGLKAVNRFSPLAVLNAMGRSDLLISGGGSLLQDRTSTRSVRYYLAIIQLARLLGKPAFLFANGIGPLERQANRKKVCRCIEGCGGVTLRDSDSLRLLREIGVQRQDIAVTADPAFTLHASDRGRELLAEQGIPMDRPLLGVSLRRVSGVEEDLEAFAALCDRLSRGTAHTIVFLPMQEPSDAQVSEQVGARMEEPYYLARTPEQPEDMLSVIDCMDLLISMRLHTIIFAAKERVPVVGCVYDPKVEAFLKLLNMPSCGTPEALDVDRAVSEVRRILDRRREIREELDGTVRQMERETDRTTALLEELLKRKGIL